MPDPRHDLGLAAETATERWLTACGWRVLERRCRPRAGGELDLVAVDPRRFLVGLEVRARRTRRTGSAAESVDARRVARVRAALAAYARAAGPPPHAGLRVDLITAEPEPGGPGRWRLIRWPGVG